MPRPTPLLAPVTRAFWPAKTPGAAEEITGENGMA